MSTASSGGIAPLPRGARAAAAALIAARGLPVADLDTAPVRLLIAGRPTRPAGVVGLELHGRDALLRSLAVREEDAGAGLGRALVAAAERAAADQGAKTLWLLTETAAPFFARLGYAEVARDSAPPAIAASRQFAALCPASATCMRRDL